MPTVVLQGTDDPIIHVESVRDLAANIRDADLFIIPGVGHDIPRQLCRPSSTRLPQQRHAQSAHKYKEAGSDRCWACAGFVSEIAPAE
ncbi:MAG TPA: alpha/beta hydrolase [Nitrososphaera sp.]|nr:alpha/beta hydrolase [Nitrososphaera sp.]